MFRLDPDIGIYLDAKLDDDGNERPTERLGMRIAHLCVSNFFIDNRAYQENELVRQHVATGHDVLVLASTESNSLDGKIIYVDAMNYQTEEGARIIRLPYSKLFPHKISRKLRIHPGLMAHLEEFKPDTILFHGACGWELLTAANYAKENPAVPLYVDSHEDWNNSARSFASREFLHRIYYGRIIRRAMPDIRKILCVSTESIDFVHELYRVPRDLLEFYPLGGRPVPDQEYELRRAAARNLYGLGPQEIAFVQSGKQTKRKKLIESLTAFAAVPDARFRLLIAGVLSEDIRKEATSLIASDPRVSFLGWKSPEELTSLLCAADIYLQPGTQSATMQNSLCARCAVILDDVPAHAVYYRENGWLIGPNRSLLSVLSDISTKNPDLARMQATSFEVAKSMLDYAVLAERVLR